MPPQPRRTASPAPASRESSHREIRGWEGPGHSLIQSVKNLSVDRLCESLCIKGEAGASKPGLLSVPWEKKKKKSEPDVAGALRSEPPLQPPLLRGLGPSPAGHLQFPSEPRWVKAEIRMEPRRGTLV